MHTTLHTQHSLVRYTSLALSISLAASAYLHAAPPNFEDHILPILEQSCTNCHNPDKQKGGLDLSTYSALMRGGSGGKVADPGEGADSRLYGVITHTLKPKMPPKGEKLEKKDADLIRAWVDSGLLENKSGKPKKKKKPAFALQTAPSTDKPDKIAMPRHLLLEPVVTSEQGSVVADMASSPWAPVLAITGQRQVLLYHTRSLQLIGILPFEPGQPEALSFHPSGKYLLAGGGIGGKTGTTVTWDIESGKEILRAGKDFDSCIAASLRTDLGGVSFGGPAKRVKLWDTTTDEQLISIKKHTDWVTQLAYSPDGILLASGGRGSGVYVWEADTGNPFHELRGHKAAITAVAWRADSNLLATASEDGTVLIWEMNNGRQVKKITAHSGGVLSLDWTRNGHLVTSGRDKKVKIWKPDFNLLKELPAFSNMVTEVAFSHDGSRVFTADWSGDIAVWDTKTFKPVGAITMNPPTIATRLTGFHDELNKMPDRIKSAEKELEVKAKAHQAAEANLRKIETDHQAALNKVAKLQKERSQLEAQLKKLYQQGDTLNKRKQQRQQSLARARDVLNKHNKAIADTRNQQREADNELKKLTAQEKQLAKIDAAAREKLSTQPDDPVLKHAAAKAKTNLENHRNKLATARSIAQQKASQLVQLTKEQKGPGNKLAAEEKAWKEILTQLKTHHDSRKPLQDRRQVVHKTIRDTQQLAEHLKKQLKPARDKLLPAQATMEKSQNHLKALRLQYENTQAAIRHWQAAAINSEAIKLRKQAASLTLQHHELMDTFTTLAREIQQLKDPGKLKQKATQLQKIRRQIDAQSSQVLDLQAKAKQRRADYMKAVK